jgi:hypothetical protein
MAVQRVAIQSQLVVIVTLGAYRSLGLTSSNMAERHSFSSLPGGF